MADFHGWESHVTSLLSVSAVLVHTRAPDYDSSHFLQLISRPTRWVIHTVDGLPTFVSGRVALLGDAVSDHHRFSPSSLL